MEGSGQVRVVPILAEAEAKSEAAPVEVPQVPAAAAAAADVSVAVAVAVPPAVEVAPASDTNTTNTNTNTNYKRQRNIVFNRLDTCTKRRRRFRWRPNNATPASSSNNQNGDNDDENGDNDNGDDDAVQQDQHKESAVSASAPPLELKKAWTAYLKGAAERDVLIQTTAKKQESVRQKQKELEEAEQELQHAQAQLATFETGPLQTLQEAVASAELEHCQGNDWNRNYLLLKAYKEQHYDTTDNNNNGAHFDLPARCPDDKEKDFLCCWLARQRGKRRDDLQAQKRGLIARMGDDRRAFQMRLLEQLGIQWTNKIKDKWNVQYDELVQYKALHGHCSIPQKYPQNQNLAYFVVHTRQDMLNRKRGGTKKSFLTTERIEMLNKIGFCWNVFDQRWKEMYQKLRSFHATHGHVDVNNNNNNNNKSKNSKNDQALSNWVQRQHMEYQMYQDEERRKNRKCRMTEERIELLGNLGFWE